MCHIFTSDDDAPEAAPEVHFKATATAEKLITTDSVGITSTGGFNSKSYWDTWSKARSMFCGGVWPKQTFLETEKL